MTDEDSSYPPAKNEILQEVMRVAPTTDAFEACLVGNLPRAAAFLDKEPNAIRGDKLGWSLLHAAAYSGNVDLVKLLISRGAVVDAIATTKYKNTPLQTAMLTGQGAVARVLVEAGADVNHKQWEGFTVLHYAARPGKLDLVPLLINRGADVHPRDIP